MQLETEINALKKLQQKLKNQLLVLLEVQKFQQKLDIIKNLIPKFDNIIIVGGMANNIISYKGNNIGKSIKEENCEAIINEIFETSKNHSCEIIFPEDVSVGKKLK